MSRNALAPIRSSAIDRPQVVVLDEARPGYRSSPMASPLARFVLSVTPDLLRAVERSISRRQEQRAAIAPVPLHEQRTYTSAMQFTEYDVDVRVPFVRHVTVRRATAWAVDAPVAEPAPSTSSRRRRAGMVGVGGVLALTALGMLANRLSSSPGVLGRRN